MARSLTTNPKAVGIPATGAACWLQTQQGKPLVLKVEEEMLPAKAWTMYSISRFKQGRENVKIETIRTSQSPKGAGKVREPQVAAVA